ncbi:hypothetical protein HCU62_00515 [Dissulfurirhabdus thermomarina]|uniref:hypothetical protein n=1 Tax=Dissulfurirhabdus thermomarina TaxID=1765737 RepID=UPI001470570F|nr:hypothetical protein [Dissulfurirhabdus thermomarina]NMX22430.1 hypothetical protein [Dissulfurirhabdus thermomarina]
MRGGAGFSAVELAVALVIIGAIMGIAISAWSVFRVSRQYAATRNRLVAAKNCLEVYASHSRKVPPASYFDARCRAPDAWGHDLVYEVTAAMEGLRVDCSAPNLAGRVLRLDDGDHNATLLVAASYGANGVRDYTANATTVNFRGTDDLPAYVTIHEIYQICCGY